MNITTPAEADATRRLGVGAILPAALPSSLLTDHAPERYMVEAPLTRKPLRAEIEQIIGNWMRAELDAAGYPHPRLAIADRRLVISNTNLAELHNGLAGIIGSLIGRISDAALYQQDQAAADLIERADMERRRFAAVTQQTRAIRFDATEPSPHVEIDEWESEGGTQLTPGRPADRNE